MGMSLVWLKFLIHMNDSTYTGAYEYCEVTAGTYYHDTTPILVEERINMH